MGSLSEHFGLPSDFADNKKYLGGTLPYLQTLLEGDDELN